MWHIICPIFKNSPIPDKCVEYFVACTTIIINYSSIFLRFFSLRLRQDDFRDGFCLSKAYSLPNWVPNARLNANSMSIFRFNSTFTNKTKHVTISFFIFPWSILQFSYAFPCNDVVLDNSCKIHFFPSGLYGIPLNPSLSIVKNILLKHKVRSPWQHRCKYHLFKEFLKWIWIMIFSMNLISLYTISFIEFANTLPWHTLDLLLVPTSQVFEHSDHSPHSS